METKKIIGIYKITSPTGKVYIGQSVNIERRFRNYKLVKCEEQIRLYNSFKKHGVNNHIFEIIEECSIELLNKKERYWQDEYNVLLEGLNCRLTLSDNFSGYMSDDTKERMKENHWSRKMKSKRIGTKLPQEVKEKIRGTNKLIFSGKGNPMYGKFGKDHPATGKGKIIQQYDFNKNLIDEGTRDHFMKIGFKTDSLYNCCLMLRKTHKNYIWKYKDDDLFVWPALNNKSKMRGRIVIKMDCNNNIIEEGSMAFFKKQGYSASGISNVCYNRHRTHLGYFWKLK